MITSMIYGSFIQFRTILSKVLNTKGFASEEYLKVQFYKDLVELNTLLKEYIFKGMDLEIFEPEAHQFFVGKRGDTWTLDKFNQVEKDLHTLFAHDEIEEEEVLFFHSD